MSLKPLETLLTNTRKYIEGKTYSNTNISGEKFEYEVYKVMESIAKKIPNDISVAQTGAQTFPDIIITIDSMTYGIEVKYSKSGHWTSLGNSVFESTSVQNLSEVFIFFGKKISNHSISVKFCEYSSALIDIKVTHSPRFFIDMETTSTNDGFILKEANSYNDFREATSDQKIQWIQSYFKAKNLNDSKWFIESKKEEQILQSSIRPYNELNYNERLFLVTEAYVLFPEIISSLKNPNKYHKVVVYWLTEYQVYSHNLRDIFSAGGKIKISFDNKDFEIPRSVHNLSTNIELIFNYLQDPINESKLRSAWGLENSSIGKIDYKEHWKSEVLQYLNSEHKLYISQFF
ncbi:MULTISPECIES: hypothetical protein [unclassified Exiguobacterium]|uniref:hypothetical protein n=1 Tax=unclassified Exiguobacterium TaxID=2644629 RepID=UPI001BE86902|nr:MULTISPECIES: hypothetical protein [unclassified Exiguobacterium]